MATTHTEIIHAETRATIDPTLFVENVRKDFPILARKVHGQPLIYLDSAASTQKPRQVIDAIKAFYENDYANIHRGVHHLSQVATDAYEGAREKLREFLGAESEREIIFTRGTTESINLVAQSFVRPRLQPGDEIMISAMEHHSNIVPWQMICEATGAKLVVVPINDHGALELDAFDRLLNERTKFFAIVHVSNALGTVTPIKTLIDRAHAKGVPVLVDGAQAVPHLRVDVKALGCDFYALSGHKLYGPSGIGALYGKAEHLEAMPPYQGGGDMIASVSFEKTTYNEIPFKFEAGTPNIAGAVGLGAAIDWVNEVGIDQIAAYEQDLLAYGTHKLQEIEGLKIIGTSPCKAGVLSFTLDRVHPHDIGTILDMDGIAIRTGHHCAQPVMDRFGIAATARASLGCYNRRDELDALAHGIRKVMEMFG